MAKVLVVDDSSMMRLLLRKTLHSRGYDVVDAADGAAAVRLYAAERPDVVILDLHLEEMSGVDVLAQLRAIDGAPRVILVSAESEAAMRTEGERAGARAVLSKPFTPDHLAETVAAVLAA